MDAGNHFRMVHGTRATLEIKFGERSIEIDAAVESRTVGRTGVEAFCCAGGLTRRLDRGWVEEYIEGNMDVVGR